MNLRDRFVATVRSYVRTPFAHGGRKPGVALDCVGVPIAALRACGIDVLEPEPYGRVPSGVQLLAGLAGYCGEMGPSEPRAVGDIVALLLGREARHVGVLVGETASGEPAIVHAMARIGVVSLDALRAHRVHSWWRVRGMG